MIACNWRIVLHQYVHNGFTHQANYRSGLRVLDATNVAVGQLNEVAFFDIYPADDNAEFNAARSNYPYFASGVVVVSGIEQGLFVLRLNLGTVDNPPTVSLTNPLDNSSVSGIVTLTAVASDDIGVMNVEFSVDGLPLGIDTDGSDGWSFAWDTTSATEGAHSVFAKAMPRVA